jgi:NAD(P)-dependent dehydrogenase (short-subunit alcohol dehydrogenase family)
VAVLFAREGADVAIVYLSEHADAEETRHIEAEGRRCLLIPGDVKDPAFCQAAVARRWRRSAARRAGQQRRLPGACGVHRRPDEERFDETLRTNVYGYFHMAKAAVPHLKAGASIINTGSVTGLNGQQGSAGLFDTKGAIHAFTKALASSLISKGHPCQRGGAGAGVDAAEPGRQGARRKVAEFGAKTDFGRPAQPEELSPAYVFLAAPSCSSYITGEILPIIGGG